MKRTLFLVNTPYQLMVVVNLATNVYGECENDVIISNRIAGYEDLARRLEKEDVFNKVYRIRLNNICPQFKKRVAIKNVLINPFVYITKQYNFFLFANLNYDVSCLYRALKKNNSHIKLFMFEDGFASYSSYYQDMLEMYQAKGKDVFKRPIHYILNCAFRHIEGMYVFEPDFMSYRPSFPVIQMKNINATENKLVNLYNSIFDYNPDVDNYDKKIIFFEESYYADGYDIDDIGEVEKIASIVGKENIFIKIHPRNPNNRFKEMGYMTNKNTAIPWEVIAMNLDLTNKILISIASVSVFVPATMLGKKYKGILLMKNIKDDSALKKNITNLYETICEMYDNIYIVKSDFELKKILN